MRSVERLTDEIKTEYADLLDARFPTFSRSEMERRAQRLDDLIERQALDALMIVESLRAGTATGWVTGWPVTAEAVTAIAPNTPRRMYIQHYNHLMLAQQIAFDTQVSWGESSGVMAAAEALKGEGVKRLGVIGRLTPAQYAALGEQFQLVDANRDYTRLRLVKSEEEIRWQRLGAAFTDLGITSLAERARPGNTERELGAFVEAPYVLYGATNALHYFLAKSMAAPEGAVPRQFASSRKLEAGDVLATEISADYWGYTGQVLRTFFIDAEPSPLYRELHAVAEATFDAVLSLVRPGTHATELTDASALIEDAGFTTIDDLVHGYGGGYLPPVLGSRSRPAAGAAPELTLEAGMALVVQPNVVTTDGSAGVQTGHLVLVTEGGAEALQAFPRGYQVL